MSLARLLPSQLGRALRLVWDSSGRWSVVTAALLLAQAVLSVAALVLVKLVIDAVTAGLAGADPTEAFRRVAFWIAVAAGVALLTALCRSADSAIGELQREHVSDRIHDVVHAKAVAVDLEYYENADYYHTLHRAQVEAPTRAGTMVANLLQVGRSGVSLVAVGGLLLAFNWWIALVLVVGDLPGALVRLRAGWELYRWQQQSTPLEVRARYYGSLICARQFAQELRVFDLGGLFAERFRALRRELREQRRRLVLRRLAAELAAQAAATAAIYAAFGYVAYQALGGAITLGDLVMYYAAFQRGQGYLQDLLFGVGRFYEDSLFVAELTAFLALDEKVPEPAAPVPVPRPLREGIVFEHVDFRYPTADILALDDVSLTARPGERVVIVGPNGSGKSTLVKLLCRLYDPQAGRVTADGTPLPCFAKAAWRRELGVLVQEQGGYYLSARENIWLGKPVAMPDESPIVAAARLSGAHAVIERLPHGYDTVLGSVLERGAELSVGEWQKVSLARTYIRDAQIVVLDEPTSAMDALAEQEFLQTFWTMARDRITIVISHRLSTARLADRIYVLADGRIVETGTHDALMRQDGTYAQLFQAQAQHYHG